jgi:hypothetical protein
MPNIDHTLVALKIMARFEEGKPADPCQNLSEEDCAKWNDMNEQYGDKFKTAEDKTLAELYKLATWEEGHKKKDDDPRDHEGEGSLIPGMEEKKASGLDLLTQLAAEISKNAFRMGDPTDGDNTSETDSMLARFEEGKPANPCQNMTDKDCAEWKQMNEKHKDNFKTAVNLPADVERYVKEVKEGNPDYTEEQIWATAWSIYCRNNSDSEHCHQKDYLKAARVPSGLYGYTRSVQSSCEGSIRKLTRVASALAKKAYQKDDKVPEFLALHAKRGSSLTAKILVSAMKGLGPKVAAKIAAAEKEAETKTAKTGPKYGLYGYASKTANLGLTSCSNLWEAAGHISSDLHGRKADSHPHITGFFQSHAKQARCLYSMLLHSAYPDADRKCASVKTPQNVAEWISWED